MFFVLRPTDKKELRPVYGAKTEYEEEKNGEGAVNLKGGKGII